MKFLDPREEVSFAVTVSVRAESALMLSEMANDMNIPLDELISGIVEDSVTGFGASKIFTEDVLIPDRCSTDDLQKLIE